MPRFFACAAVFLFAGSAASQQPAYRIEATEHQKVNATITYEIRTADFAVSKWMVFLPEPPDLPSQTKVTATADPVGKLVTESSPLARKVRYLDIPVANPAPGGKLSMKLEVEATLLRRNLVELKSGEKPPEVPALAATEKRYYLSSTKQVDHDARPFQEWLDTKKLRSKAGEPPIDFAARVLEVIRADYGYHYDAAEDKRASVACRAKATDCAGMTYLFVATMRAHDIPARVLVGRHARPRKPDSTAATTDYDRPHVRAEMFVAGIGWVPVEPAYAREQKRRPVTAFIGHDPGDMLVLHVDVDLRLPFPDKEREVDLLQIGPCYWTTGTGKFDGSYGPTGWELKATLIEKK